MKIEILWFFLLAIAHFTIAAIIPPPWSDPSKNPCALMPGGWQLLYWPPLDKCFKIFQKGYPCPDTMELAPIGIGITASGSTAECRCPPGTAQSPKTSKCHKLFEKGPCELGEYFAPVPDSPGKSAIPKQRWGICKSPGACTTGMAYWPPDGQCYPLHSRGPCAKGKLFTLDNDNLASCRCENHGDLSKFYDVTSKLCFEHFSKGPCDRTGELFLPSRKCGCHQSLPQYHNETNQCYELNSPGPCPIGHIFRIADLRQDIVRAECQCKDGYVLWRDGFCYRLYTKGPCDEGEFIVNRTTCIRNPCEKGRLYFPEENTCYKIGTQGPCSLHQVVVFDFTTRPSLEGISYNGLCGCNGVISSLDQNCGEVYPPKTACQDSPGMVEISGVCYKLYTRANCGPGQWLEPKRGVPKSAKCQCRPGYTPYSSTGEEHQGVLGCHAPSVSIARYLNGKTYKNYKFGFRRVL